MRFFKIAIVMVVSVLVTTLVAAQDRRLSPRGQASAQVGGSFNSEGRYSGGDWIDVEYGRPLLRGRDNMFGSGDTYGEIFLRGAPIWRIGADQSTRFKTEADLMFGSQRLEAGEYSMAAELEEGEWTLIFHTWGVKEAFREENAGALWGAYEYTPDRDVLRTTMRVTTHPVSAEQLIITFTDMTLEGGQLTIWWDDQVASTSFSRAR